MPNISDYIQVTITRLTQGVKRTGFGTCLLLGEVSEFYERTKSYNSIAAVADDFASTDTIYLMAAKFFSQSPRPRTLKVGRKYANVNAKQTLSPDANPTAGTYTITLGALTTAAINYDGNAAAIKAALEALATVTEVTVTGSLSAGDVVVEFTGADANTHFATMSVDASGLTTTTAVTVTVNQYGSATETWVEAISNVVAFDNDWYCLVATTRTEADILLIAADIEARRKIYIAGSEDAAVITSATDDVASDLKTANYIRTALAYSETSGHYFDIAWAAHMLAKDAGSSTWAFKSLNGITSDTYTDSELAYALGKYANVFIELGGKDVTLEGTVAKGEYIDITRGIDYIQARLEENIFEVLSSVDKIPYTANGIAVIEGIIRQTLEDAYRNDIIVKPDGGFDVTVPNIDDISTTEKATRILPDVEFTATMKGAIHEVVIQGLVQV